MAAPDLLVERPRLRGRLHQVAAFLESVARAGEMPISLESLVATTRASLAAAGGADVRGSVSP